MAVPSLTDLVVSAAKQFGVDPQAALAVASREGLGGGIGDGGHAFGPFQLNNAGGVLTGKFQGETPQQIQDWATTPQGVNYAVAGLAKVAHGLHGANAINAIVRQFERPANPDAEVAGADRAYEGLPVASPVAAGNGAGVTAAGPLAAAPAPQTQKAAATQADPLLSLLNAPIKAASAGSGSPLSALLSSLLSGGSATPMPAYHYTPFATS